LVAVQNRLSYKGTPKCQGSCGRDYRERFVVRAAGGDNPVTGGKMDWINLRAWVRLYRMKITRVNSKDVDQKQAERGRRSLILRPPPHQRGSQDPCCCLRIVDPTTQRQPCFGTSLLRTWYLCWNLTKVRKNLSCLFIGKRRFCSRCVHSQAALRPTAWRRRSRALLTFW
jgi:hypothetical protein